MKNTSQIQKLTHLGMWIYLLSPMFFLLFYNSSRGFGDLLYLYNLWTSLLWVFILYFLFNRPLYVHAFLLPLYLTTAVDLFLIGVFGGRFSSSFFYIALTDNSDTYEFFRVYARPIILSIAMMLCIYIGGLYAIRHIRHNYSRKIGMGFIFLLIFTYSAAFMIDLRKGFTLSQSTVDVFSKELGSPMGAPS